MRFPVRIAFVVVGLAAAVCGLSWLTGGWLGIDLSYASTETVRMPLRDGVSLIHHSGAFEAVALILVGLALAAFGSWPRRRRTEAAP